MKSKGPGIDLATLLGNLPGMAYRCLVDEDWTMLFVSEGAEALTGHPASRLVGDESIAFADLILEEDRALVWEGVQDALEKRGRFELIYRIRRADGRIAWVGERGIGLVGDDGEVSALEGFIEDITARIESQEALSHRLERERVTSFVAAKLVGAVPEEVSDVLTDLLPRIGGVIGVDRVLVDLVEGTRPRQGLRQFFGWAAEHATIHGDPWRGLESPAGNLAHQQWLGLSHQQGTIALNCLDDLPPELVEARRLCELRGVSSVLVSPVHFRGQVLGGLIFEVTGEGRIWRQDEIEFSDTIAAILSGVLGQRLEAIERQRLESELIESQRMEAMGQLVAGVAHEFNNLLTSIQGSAELLSMGGELQGEATEDVRRILAASGRAAEITQQLLAFGRKQVYEPRAINLNEVVTETLSLVKPIIGEDIELVTVLDDDLGLVKADPRQMGQVLLNLMTNARDAMPQGGRLTLRTKRAELLQEREGTSVPALGLHVSDTGSGISEDEQQKIFEPFFTTKKVGSGSGLGLATVHGIVEQNRGRILVESAPGKGSTFSVLLPLLESSSQVLHEDPSSYRNPESAPEPSAPCKLLLVEDEESVRSLVVRMLSGSVYEIREASSAEHALRVVEDEGFEPQVLLTDVVMPGVSGVDLYRRLTERIEGLGVVFMSGYPEQAVSKRGELPAGTPLLQKPFDRQALVACISEARASSGRPAGG